MSVKGQRAYGRLKLSTTQGKQFIWTDFSLSNIDTTIHLYLSPYHKTTIYDSIPQGEYNLTLFSELNDKINTTLSIKRQTRFTLSTKDYYSFDLDTTTFVSKIKEGDTINVFVHEYGCFHMSKAYCRITYKDNSYFIHFNTQNGRINHRFTEEELKKIEQIEIRGRNTNKNDHYATTSSWYFISLNRKLLKFQISGTNYISHLYSEIIKEN